MPKFCTQCGAAVSEAARFCNKCGTPFAPTQQASSATPPGTAPTMKYEQSPGYNPAASSYQPPQPSPHAPPTAQGDLKPNVAAMLSYLLSIITGVIFLVLVPYNRDRFVRFHAYQSIFFFVALVVLNVVISVLPWRLERLLDGLLSLLSLGGTIWLMYQAYQGQMFKLPIVGDWAERQANKP